MKAQVITIEGSMGRDIDLPPAFSEEYRPDLIRKAVIYANIVASFNVQGLGIQGLDGIGMVDIRKRFAEYRKNSAFPSI